MAEVIAGGAPWPGGRNVEVVRPWGHLLLLNRIEEAMDGGAWRLPALGRLADLAEAGRQGLAASRRLLEPGGVYLRPAGRPGRHGGWSGPGPRSSA